MSLLPPRSTLPTPLFPYPPRFRSCRYPAGREAGIADDFVDGERLGITGDDGGVIIVKPAHAAPTAIRLNEELGLGFRIVEVEQDDRKVANVAAQLGRFIPVLAVDDV